MTAIFTTVAHNFKLEMIAPLPFAPWRAFCRQAQAHRGLVMRDLDIPPVWLVLALAVSWALSRLWSVAAFTGFGKVLIAFALILMLAAVGQMVARRTTFIPRRDPQALIATGVFALSRNPIYLADVLILTGAILYWGAVLALPVIPAFIALITQRYIRDEETRLRAGFGLAASQYFATVPRWIWRF